MALQGIGQTSDATGSLTLSIDGAKGLKLERKSTVNFLANFDLTDDENFVLANCGLTIGTAHPTDSRKILTDLSCSCNGRASDKQQFYQWKITASYGPLDPEDLKDPLAMDPKVSFIPERVPEPVFQDIDGKPITNPAGDYYDPPIERPGFTGILRVVLNRQSSDIYPTWLALAEHINESPWLGFEAKTVRFAPPALPEREWYQEGHYYYYPFTLEFEVAPRNWKAKPLRSGFRRLTVDGKVVMIQDDSGQPLSSPGLLTPEGEYVKPPVDPELVTFDEYDIFQTADFAQFGLDEAIIFA